MIKQRLFAQFRNPHGPLGWVAGRIMSKRESNVARTLATVDLLETCTGDRVLEIGHGPGVGLEAALAVSGDVVGLERSTSMRSMAARRNRAAVRDGRLVFVVADAQDPPPGLDGFDADLLEQRVAVLDRPGRHARSLAGPPGTGRDHGGDIPSAARWVDRGGGS